MDVFTEKKRREIMSRVKNRNTRQELLVRSLLHRLGYRFRVHRGDLPGTPDIVLPKYRTAIFVNGCFWHGHSCPRGRLPASNRDYWKAKINTNIARDRQNYKSLARLQWKTIVVWACETSSLVKLTDWAIVLRSRSEAAKKECEPVVCSFLLPRPNIASV